MLCGKSEAKTTASRKGKCDICKRKKPVAEKHTWGVFTPEAVVKARRSLKSAGEYGSKIAEPDDVTRLIDVVEGVLKDQMSFMTRKIIKQLREALRDGKTIELYDTKQLAYWYAQDVKLMGESTDEG